MLRVEHLLLTNNTRISFEVADSKCLAVHGPSGAGKTRLLRAIADLDETPGQVFLDGAERHEMTAPEWRKQVRYVAAEPGWWTDTPRPAFPTGKPETVKLVKLLRNLNIDVELLDRPISRLSTGERQRLAIARAMIDNPHVLLLDEPTAALDKANAALVEELIKYQLLSGKIIVLVSHDTAQIKRLSATTLELETGPSRTNQQHAPAKTAVRQ